MSQHPNDPSAGERVGRPPVVTLDGPAGSGKSTTATEVARILGFRHLDSGALYRALTAAALARGLTEADLTAYSVDDFRAFRVSVDPESREFQVLIDGEAVSAELRTREVTDLVSRLAAFKAARECLLEIQRDAGRAGALVADGRDMGTVVFPDAEVKIFMVADLEERARRRVLEVGDDAQDADSVAAQAAALGERDRRDTEREVSPLRVPEGAHEIDTTAMTFEAQVAHIVKLVEALTIP